MNTPQPPNLEKLRERRKVPLEGIAWLSFVLLTLAFGIFMTFKSYGVSTNLVENHQQYSTRK